MCEADIGQSLSLHSFVEEGTIGLVTAVYLGRSELRMCMHGPNSLVRWGCGARPRRV